MKIMQILLFLAILLFSYSQDVSATLEAMQSTFNFQGDTSGAATCFMVNKNNRQYFVTAAHIFKSSHKSGHVVRVKLLNQNYVESYDATVHFHTNRNVDVAVMVLPKTVTQGPGISLDSIFVLFGSEVFFCGFPLGNLGTEVLGIKFPLIKRAIISGQVKYQGVDVVVLDGHNNSGFSGGPVVAYDSSGKKMHVIAVVAGFFS